ncbi:O-antigen ligase family protein [Streptococcus suis]|uniref:O-antigen ligase family protein n=1 Tax=Streptococcus suis TaxID=1307 RepID=A0A9X4MLD0_STRSU|nr:O-antigen ligase family protein [Streptococcus suis]
MSKKIYTYGYVFMIIGYVLDYSINFSGIGAAIKYLFTFLLLSFLVREKLKFKNYTSLLAILCPFFIVPLILVLAGKYVIDINSVLIYSGSYIVFVLLAISIIELFPNVLDFCKVTNFALVFPLGLNVIMSGQFSLNIKLMIFNMIGNTRVDRAMLGFPNPNTTGLIATMGFVLILAQFFYHKVTIGNIVCALFYLLVIINTGSRTALFSPVLGLIIVGCLTMFKKISPKIRIAMACFIVAAIIFSVYYSLLSKGLKFDFEGLNKLTSYRFQRQITTLRYLNSNNLLTWGVGNLNSTGLYSNSIGLFLNTDNSPIYFIVTIGLVGLCQVVGILLWILSKIELANKVGLFCFLTMIITSFFEHTLFVSTSLFSLLFLVIIYISISEKRTIKTAKGEKAF